jgi:hypothetical protein
VEAAEGPRAAADRASELPAERIEIGIAEAFADRRDGMLRLGELHAGAAHFLLGEPGLRWPKIDGALTHHKWDPPSRHLVQA